MTPLTFGQRLRQLRESRGLTGNALAQLAGMKQQTVWRLETGERTPSLESLRALARALGVEEISEATFADLGDGVGDG